MILANVSIIKWTEDLPIFTNQDYLKIQSPNYGWIAGYRNNDDKEPICFLPFTISRKLFFKWITFHSGIAKLSDSFSETDEIEFLNSLPAFLKSKKIDFVTPLSAQALSEHYPNNAVYAPFGSYIIDLSLDEKALWDNLHSKHRNVIRKAKKEGVEIREGKKFSRRAYGLIKEAQIRSGNSSVSIDYFEKLVGSLGDWIKIFVAFYKNEPQGCAVMPYSKFGAFYLYGGSCSKPFTGSLNLLHWEALRYFKSIGVKYYDFTGARLAPEKDSKLEGIQRFKSRFGGELKRGYLWKLTVNNRKYFLYKNLLKLRSVFKGQKYEEDVIDQERKKHTPYIRL